MNLATDTQAESSYVEGQQRFFRCPVQESDGHAIIRIGRRKIKAIVQETSIEGFTVTVKPKHAARIQVGGPWELNYDGARIEVHPQWIFNSPDGHVQLGLRRLRDLTKPEPIRSSWLVRFGGGRFDDPSNAAVAFGGFVLALFAVLASPGLGEKLGTSSRIQSTFQWLASGVSHQMDQWF
ncbi:hypothetical protein [Novipirellula artificiosorum]|nr:hypothetical protein [Novipirellula artificiosorum]